MQISFTSNKLRKSMSNDNELRKAYGKECAVKLQKRLMELYAAPTMANIPSYARCHPLIGNKQELYAVYLQHPQRLVFQPDCEEIPRKEDGGMDLSKVTAIIILSVEDYH